VEAASRRLVNNHQNDLFVGYQNSQKKASDHSNGRNPGKTLDIICTATELDRRRDWQFALMGETSYGINGPNRFHVSELQRSNGRFQSSKRFCENIYRLQRNDSTVGIRLMGSYSVESEQTPLGQCTHTRNQPGHRRMQAPIGVATNAKDSGFWISTMYLWWVGSHGANSQDTSRIRGDKQSRAESSFYIAAQFRERLRNASPARNRARTESLR
jgi:hypothetical protein